MKAVGDRGIPDFLIIGTQKAGTTWLMRKLAEHPKVFMASRQVHFFDREYKRGSTWYRRQFSAAKNCQIVGEKTTEYFDTATMEVVPRRIAELSPSCKMIVILRNPVERAWSAMVHHVNAGLIPLPSDANEAVLDVGSGIREPANFRFVERGFYAKQLEAFYACFNPSQMLVLVFEDDIVANPELGWSKVCHFLDIPVTTLSEARRAENQVRLSALGCRMAYVVRQIPKARSLLRRVDRVIGKKPWMPQMCPETRRSLEEIYAQSNRELYDLLGEEIPSWRLKS